MKKQIKFREHLIPFILSGEKDATWRLLDDKDLQVGDELEFLNWATKEKFAEGTILAVKETTLGKLIEKDFDGHEKFESDKAMYRHYRELYGDKVGPDTPLKIIKFKLA